MKVMNLLSSGNIGGIERLCLDIGQNSIFENGFCFLFEGGVIYEEMQKKGLKTYCLADGKRKLSLNRFQNW